MNQVALSFNLSDLADINNKSNILVANIVFEMRLLTDCHQILMILIPSNSDNNQEYFLFHIEMSRKTSYIVKKIFNSSIYK